MEPGLSRCPESVLANGFSMRHGGMTEMQGQVRFAGKESEGKADQSLGWTVAMTEMQGQVRFRREER